MTNSENIDEQTLAASEVASALKENTKQLDDSFKTRADKSDQQSTLILINPHSGQGKSLKIFQKQVLRILESHQVQYDIFVTTAELRVKDYLLAKTLDELNRYKSIIVVSGDGLMFETVNAIMTRPDWRQAIKIPLGVIPTGSGNGLAYTLIKSSRLNVKHHTEAVRICCEQAIQAGTCTSDLVRLRYGKDTSIWSFLSIGWGLLADIDIDSEWLRFLGEFRFTLYGVIRSLTSVSYKGRLSYKAAPLVKTDAKASDAPEDSTKDSQDKDQDWTNIEDDFACLYAVHQTYVNSATNFSPKSNMTDHLTYLTYITGKLNIYQVIEFLLAIENGSHEKLSYVKVVPVRKFEFQPLEASKVVVDGEVIPWTVTDGPISVEVMPKVLTLSWSD